MEWELAILFSAVMNNAVNTQVDITDLSNGDIQNSWYRFNGGA